ncbi:spermidine dicoumaroyl transferase [Sarracenia purpurea var. burkii]
MDLLVVRSSGGLVPPASLTPSGMLQLSVIDRLPVLRCNARTLHVFRHGPGAPQVIKEALAKALVPYYPLAGRLKESSHGELQIECRGEGVWFVEASADCTLDALNYFEDATPIIPFDKLLPHHPPQTQALDPLVLMQVTQFACDGFVIGLTFCHSICDGLGAAQFLRAVGELGRNVQHPSVEPVWQRDLLPPPQPGACHCAAELLPPSPPLPLPNYQLEHANIDIPFDQINQLKQKFHESTGQTCSAFEVIAATLWKRRTQAAIKSDKNTEVKLVFFVNCRQLVQPPLPEGYYGNCFFPVTVAASSETLWGASNADVVKMIQEAKAGLAIQFGKWIKGEAMRKHGNGNPDPFAPPLAYTTLFVSEWGRLGFNQVDYGWGPPVHFIPVQGSAVIPVAILGSVPPPKTGIRLMTWCVELPHLPPFLHQMANLKS